MAITLISTLTDANIDSPLLILDGKRAIVGHTANNTLSVIDIEDPRNPTVKTTTSAISNMIPRDGLRIGDSYWITSGATDDDGTIFEMTLNNLQTRSSINNIALADAWKFSGHNDGYAALYQNYLYIPTRSTEGGPLIAIVDYESRTLKGSFVPEAAEPKVTRVYGCYLFVGSELAPEFQVYDLAASITAPTALGEVEGPDNDDIGPVQDMLIHPSNGYVYTISRYLAYGPGFNHDFEMQAILITDPTTPVLVDGYDDPTKMDVPQSVTRIGERLYTAVDNYDAAIQLEVENFADLPQFEQELLDNTNLAGAQAIDTDGRYLYVVGDGVFSVLDPDRVEDKNKYYGPTTIVGYNQNPPPDDGTEEGNFVRFWGKEQKKLTDPLKDAIVSLDRGINTTVQKINSLIGKNRYSSSFSYYSSGPQIVTNPDEWVLLETSLKEWDNADDFDNVGYKFTPFERGIYKMGAMYMLDPDSEGGFRTYVSALFKNGEFYKNIGRKDTNPQQDGRLIVVYGTTTFQATGCDDEFYQVFVKHNNPAENEQIRTQGFANWSSLNNIVSVWGYRVI